MPPCGHFGRAKYAGVSRNPMGHAACATSGRSLVPAPQVGPGRYMVFPATDERVLRVLRKVVRGLSHYHRIETAVSDNRVTIDVLKYAIPHGFVQPSDWRHRDPRIIEYLYWQP